MTDSAAPPSIYPTTEVHPIRGGEGELRLLGAVRQVTGAMTRVDLGGSRVLVDCGLAQGREARGVPFPDAARDIDALVLTHGHLDHIGTLPTLLDATFDKPIFATHATLAIARISLEDSLGMSDVSDRDAARFLERFAALARPLELGAMTTLPGRGKTGLELCLHEAGHILGSSSAELRTSSARVLCSGNLGRPNSPLLRDPETHWQDRTPFDLVVIETTYGNRDHAHGREDIGKNLERILTEAIARGGHILMPAFAIGRTQTLLYYVNELVESGRLPQLPVAIDTPMGLAISETYKSFSKLFDKEALSRLARGDDPLDFEHLFAVKRGRESARLAEVKGPILIIAGSGMCTGGRIVRHLARDLPDPRTTVLFVGHQADGTPGQAIQRAASQPGRTVYLDGVNTPVNATVETLSGLSAHADRGELLTWLRRLPGVDRIALHHGEVAAQEAFASFATDQWFEHA